MIHVEAANVFTWQVTLPFLVLHGGDDIVTDPSVSKLLFEEASSRDKAFKLYPGMWHALSAELPPDVEHVYSDIISWLDKRASLATCAANVSENIGTEVSERS
jgi:acylglycerol lipase